MKINILGIAFALVLGGCSTVSDWFADEEELKIKRLEPLVNQIELTQDWSNSLGDGVEHYFSRLQPVVAYGKVFAANRKGDVIAYDPETGDRIWTQDLSIPTERSLLRTLFFMESRGASAKISGGLSAAYDTVFLGTENGQVYALEQGSGNIKWRADVSGEVLAPPAIDAGVVVVNTSAGNLIGLDAENGEQLWINQSDVPPLSLRGVSGPVASSGGVLVGMPNGKLQVNIITSGLLAWEAPIATPTGATELDRIVDVDSTPSVLGGSVYVVSYNGTLASVDLRTGRVVWTREYGSFRNVEVSGNILFVVDNKSNIYAVDRRNGVELWSNSSLRNRGLTSATPSGNYIVVGDKFGFVHWFTQDEGMPIARVMVGDDDEEEGIYVAPLAVDNTVYVKTKDGQFVSISR